MTAFDIAGVRRRLPGRTIHWHARLDSTMRAAAGLPADAMVVAEEQTAGQGRHGHTWHSAPGAGLYCTIVLSPSAARPVLTLALGLAAGEAITAVTGLACDLRWPNDVMLGGRKAAGILVQMAGANPLAGIGINVNQAAFPEDLAATATSLRNELGRTVEREDLLVELVLAVDRFTALLAAAGPQAILDAFSHASSYAAGKRVRVEQETGSVDGTTDGLDPAGFLRLRRDDGSVMIVFAGGVRAAGS